MLKKTTWFKSASTQIRYKCLHLLCNILCSTWSIEAGFVWSHRFMEPYFITSTGNCCDFFVCLFFCGYCDNSKCSFSPNSSEREPNKPDTSDSTHHPELTLPCCILPIILTNNFRVVFRRLHREALIVLVWATNKEILHS